MRVTHPPSGAVGESREERSQAQNKKNAFGRMARTQKFQTWLRIESAKAIGKKSIDEIVDEQMNPSNIKCETRIDGVWTDAMIDENLEEIP